MALAPTPTRGSATLPTVPVHGNYPAGSPTVSDNNVISHPQDLYVYHVRLAGASEQNIEIRPITVEFHYYEDIYSNFLSAELVLNDSGNWHERLSMSGHEGVLLSFDKPAIGNPNNKIFRSYKTSKRRLTKDQNENYVIHLCGEEAFLNEQLKISKSYKNKKIVDIVHDIVDNILKIPANFKDTFEDTEGLYDIVIPNIKPFEAINWLCTKAIPVGGGGTQGAPFLFYCTRKGFTFRSLLSLYEQEVTKPTNSEGTKFKGFYYGTKNLDISMGDKMADIISYEIIKGFDTIDTTMNGQWANKLITVDTIRGLHSNTNFDYEKYFPSVPHLNQYKIMSNAENRFKKKQNEYPDAVIKTAYSTTGQNKNPYIQQNEPSIKDNNVEKTIPYRLAQLSLNDAIKLKIMIPGNINIKAGNKILVEIPSTDFERGAGQNKRYLDKYYSGNYIVTALHHVLNQENTFDTILEICNESLINPLIDFNNESELWTTIRSQDTFQPDT